MRRAFIVAGALVLLGLSVTPLGEGSWDAARALAWVDEALAYVDAGIPPTTSRVVAITPAGLMEHPLPMDEVRASLLDFRQLLNRPAPAGGRADAPEVILGFGSTSLDMPYPDCAPVRTDVYAWSSTGVPDQMLHVLGAPIPIAPEQRVCGVRVGALASVVIDASEALATCSMCAMRSAQFWSDTMESGTFYGDFRYVLHRGVSHASSFGVCYSNGCFEGAGFWGAHATAEIYRGDAIPGVELLKIPPPLSPLDAD